MDASARYCTDGLIRHVIVEKIILLKAMPQQTPTGLTRWKKRDSFWQPFREILAHEQWPLVQ